MNYYRTPTKILDSWDFIKLPIARRNRDQIRERSSDDNRPIALEHKGTRRKLARRKESFRHRKKIESCSSLIFKKTDKPVLNDYSAFSYTNIIQSHVHGDHGAKQPAPRKPVIKVTIIPNKDTKAGNKRKETTKKATTKKTEKFIKNKDFYYVVAGRKKEKIYLNTVTAQYSEGSLRKNDRSTNDCADIKELFKNNLNKCKKSMTHINKKNTKVDEKLVEYSSRCCECRDLKFIRTEQVEYIKMSNNKGSPVQRTKKNLRAAEELRMTIPIKENNCNLNRESQRMSPRASMNGEKNRIRITGRLGLNQDDKYVLKCNATLDDEPIPTYPTNENLMSMLCLDRDGKRSPRNQRDCKVQADFRCYPSIYGQTSQATQVNFEIIYPQKYNSTKIFANNDKIVQCYCANTSENSALASDARGDIALKECASPIVIISVYPQQESTDKVTNRFNVTDNKTKCPAQAECSERNTKKITNSEEAKIKPKCNTRSRSPSPTRHKDKTNKEVNKQSNLRTRVNVSNSKKKLGETTNSTVKTPNTMSSKIPTYSQVNSVTNKKIDRSKSPMSTKLSPTRKAAAKQKTQNTTGTNTEQRLTKKALVDNFTKQYTARMNGKCRKDIFERSAGSAKHDVSNVTINIEGDNEFYNVMFHQSARDTDLTVRKTHKGFLSNYARDNDSTSLENFLLSEHDGNRVQTSFSQTYLPSPDYPQTQPTTSKLIIKDSIQVCHRREDKHNDEIAHTDYSSNRNENNAFLAPMKHFQGDDCSISDPNERDREIRELLGVDRRNFKPPGYKSAEASTIFGRRNEVSLNCLYQDHTFSINVCKVENKDLVNRSIQHTPHYRMLILNRNRILQIKPSNKQQIVLSRHQYAKIKRAIYANILKKYSLDRRRRRPGTLKDSSVSIGSIKIKSKENMTFHHDKETQTVLDMTLSHFIGTMLKRETNHFVSSPLPCEFASSGEPHQESLEAKKGSSIHKSLDHIRSVFSNSRDKHELNSEKSEMSFFYDAGFNNSQKTHKQERSPVYPRRAASSEEVQYAEVVYTKPVKLSNPEIGSKAHLKDLALSKPCRSQDFKKMDSHSIQTIFKGRRRCHTPNLGTSAYSLCPGTSESVSEHSDLLFKVLKDPVNCEQKPKKHFLRRLISYLVMRAPETSAAKFPVGRTPKHPSVPNSDWYYINSSLCGIDMSSSLYDTSASFYSNHTIQPVSRVKRGFFSSVRGFLANRS